MLERTGRAIKNGLSRGTGNHGTRHRTKTNKTKETPQKTKTLSYINPTKKTEVKPCASEGYTIPVSHKTSAVLLI